MNAPDIPDPPSPHAKAQRARDECIAVYRKWLHVPDTGAIDVTLATVAANRAPGDPVWLTGPR